MHSDAPDISSTDWGQIVALYDQLLALVPSAVVTLIASCELVDV